MTENIQKTLVFLKAKLEGNAYYISHPCDKAYRLEHTMRVAAIGNTIAIGEGWDEEPLVIGALLHDISYCMPFHSEQDWLDHGRNAEKIARPFLMTLNLTAENVQDICYGIAMHVDDVAGICGKPTALSCSIGDADNIDRYDAYRIYENLQRNAFDTMPIDEKLCYITKAQDKLKKCAASRMATKTAQSMWNDKIMFQISFFDRLQQQLKRGSLFECTGDESVG